MANATTKDELGGTGKTTVMETCRAGQKDDTLQSQTIGKRQRDIVLRKF